MGKIVMPKNSALLNEIESVLKIYYEANDWILNDVYKARLKELIGDDQYSSSYTKKAQITSYFGFTIWKDISNPQSLRRITPSGKKMYEALLADDTDKVHEVLMTAMETVKFGRDNYGCPDSNSDVEPPALFIRAILDLGYLTYREFAWLLWKLEDLGANYTDSVHELRGLRSLGLIQLEEEANKYADCKPIIILVRWGFLAEDEAANASNGKHIIIAPSVLDKYKSRLRNLKIYNIDMNFDGDRDEDDNTESILNETIRKQRGCNVLLYGVPGCGKSYSISQTYPNSTESTYSERVVFHPDYTYSDFVGQILPKNKGESVEYVFTPGPFTRILNKAINDPTHMYYLVIEEINRGNAPAIFGDIFQLLDRDKNGASEYSISNSDIAEVVYGDGEERVSIPSNLTILATMNTADQSVFTLDTAFKRRWKLKHIKNTFEPNGNVDHDDQLDAKICETEITWKEFATKVNDCIAEKSMGINNSDKSLGVFFARGEELTDSKLFAEKIIMYLYNDVFTMNPEDLFDSKYKTLAQILDAFETEKFRIFNSDLGLINENGD